MVPVENDSVPVLGAFAVKFAQDTEPLNVTTYDAADDAESKITLSTDVGADAPLAPPDVADQFMVLEVFQVPVPPTQ